MKKLRSRRGETITETLVAILVIALSAGILAVTTTTAVHVDQTAEQATADYYAALSRVEEGRERSGTGSAVISGELALPLPEPLEISFFGATDTLISYRGVTAP